jgi:hypothetical protein
MNHISSLHGYGALLDLAEKQKPVKQRLQKGVATRRATGTPIQHTNDDDDKPNTPEEDYLSKLFLEFVTRHVNYNPPKIPFSYNALVAARKTVPSISDGLRLNAAAKRADESFKAKYKLKDTQGKLRGRLKTEWEENWSKRFEPIATATINPSTSGDENERQQNDYTAILAYHELMEEMFKHISEKISNQFSKASESLPVNFKNKALDTISALLNLDLRGKVPESKKEIVNRVVRSANVEFIEDASDVTPVAPIAPMITSGFVASGKVGSPFSYQITSDQQVNTYSAGNLPAGLVVNATGLISGTPGAAGTFSIPMLVINANGRGQGILVLTISAAATPVTPPSGPTGGSPIGTPNYFNAFYRVQDSGGGNYIPVLFYDPVTITTNPQNWNVAWQYDNQGSPVKIWTAAKFPAVLKFNPQTGKNQVTYPSTLIVEQNDNPAEDPAQGGTWRLRLKDTATGLIWWDDNKGPYFRYTTGLTPLNGLRGLKVLSRGVVFGDDDKIRLPEGYTLGAPPKLITQAESMGGILIAVGAIGLLYVLSKK